MAPASEERKALRREGGRRETGGEAPLCLLIRASEQVVWGRGTAQYAERVTAEESREVRVQFGQCPSEVHRNSGFRETNGFLYLGSPSCCSALLGDGMMFCLVAPPS